MASIVKFHMRSRRQNEFQKGKEIHIVLLQFFLQLPFSDTSQNYQIKMQ